MDQRTRKLITMYKALHPKDDVDSLYVPRKEGGRGFASTEDSVDALIQRQDDYIKKLGKRQITTTRSNRVNTSINKTKTSRKQK